MIVRPVVRSVVRPITREINGLPTPLLFMPLVDRLILAKGTGSATFTRSKTGTFLDKDDALVKTAAIDAARFEVNGVLIEGASENLALHSEEIDNAAWAKVGGITFAVNQSTGADGLQTADQITYIGGQGSPSTRATQQSVTVAGGTASKTFTVSCWVRSVSGTSKFRFNCTHGGVVPQFSPDITATTILTRHEFTVTNGVAAGNGIQFIGIIGATDDSAYDLYVWGYQFEEKPFVTSYIKTTTTSVTKTLEDLDILSSNIPAPTDDYTVSMELDILGLDSTKTQTVYSVDGETSRKIEINTTGIVEATHGEVTSVSTTSMVAGTKLRVAFVVDGTNQTLFVNGIQEDQDTKGSVTGTATAISIGNAAGLNQLFGHEKNFRIYDAALTAEQVLAL